MSGTAPAEGAAPLSGTAPTDGAGTLRGTVPTGGAAPFSGTAPASDLDPTDAGAPTDDAGLIGGPGFDGGAPVVGAAPNDVAAPNDGTAPTNGTAPTDGAAPIERAAFKDGDVFGPIVDPVFPKVCVRFGLAETGDTRGKAGPVLPGKTDDGGVLGKARLVAAGVEKVGLGVAAALVVAMFDVIITFSYFGGGGTPPR